MDNSEIRAEELYEDITNSKFDIESFDSVFSEFDVLLNPYDAEISKLEVLLEEKRKIRDNIRSLKTGAKTAIVERLDKINAKIKKWTTKAENDEDVQSNDNDASMPGSYLIAAQKPSAIVRAPPGFLGRTPEPDNNNNSIFDLYITDNIVIRGMISDDLSVAPPGNLIWIPKEMVFAIKIMVGSDAIIFRGNIGNIYVRGDPVCMVDVCRQSTRGVTCLRDECTFRHIPPKRGEIRNYFAAITYYPPRMSTLAKDHKGVHRIGSREHMAHDLNLIRRSENNEARRAYEDQAFHSFLVALVIHKGQIREDRVSRLPEYMDPAKYHKR